MTASPLGERAPAAAARPASSTGNADLTASPALGTQPDGPPAEPKAEQADRTDETMDVSVEAEPAGARGGLPSGKHDPAIAASSKPVGASLSGSRTATEGDSGGVGGSVRTTHSSGGGGGGESGSGQGLPLRKFKPASGPGGPGCGPWDSETWELRSANLSRRFISAPRRAFRRACSPTRPGAISCAPSGAWRNRWTPAPGSDGPCCRTAPEQAASSAPPDMVGDLTVPFARLQGTFCVSPALVQLASSLAPESTASFWCREKCSCVGPRSAPWPSWAVRLGVNITSGPLRLSGPNSCTHAVMLSLSGRTTLLIPAPAELILLVALKPAVVLSSTSDEGKAPHPWPGSMRAGQCALLSHGTYNSFLLSADQPDDGCVIIYWWQAEHEQYCEQAGLDAQDGELSIGDEQAAAIGIRIAASGPPMPCEGPALRAFEAWMADVLDCTGPPRTTAAAASSSGNAAPPPPDVPAGFDGWAHIPMPPAVLHVADSFVTLDIRNVDRLGMYMRASATLLGNAERWKAQRRFIPEYAAACIENNTWGFPRWQDGLATLLHEAARNTPDAALQQWAQMATASLIALPSSLCDEAAPSATRLMKCMRESSYWLAWVLALDDPVLHEGLVLAGRTTAHSKDDGYRSLLELVHGATTGAVPNWEARLGELAGNAARAASDVPHAIFVNIPTVMVPALGHLVHMSGACIMAESSAAARQLLALGHDPDRQGSLMIKHLLQSKQYTAVNEGSDTRTQLVHRDKPRHALHITRCDASGALFSAAHCLRTLQYTYDAATALYHTPHDSQDGQRAPNRFAQLIAPSDKGAQHDKRGSFLHTFFNEHTGWGQNPILLRHNLVSFKITLATGAFSGWNAPALAGMAWRLARSSDLPMTSDRYTAMISVALSRLAMAVCLTNPAELGHRVFGVRLRQQPMASQIARPWQGLARRLAAEQDPRAGPQEILYASRNLALPQAVRAQIAAWKVMATAWHALPVSAADIVAKFQPMIACLRETDLPDKTPTGVRMAAQQWIEEQSPIVCWGQSNLADIGSTELGQGVLRITDVELSALISAIQTEQRGTTPHIELPPPIPAPDAGGDVPDRPTDAQGPWTLVPGSCTAGSGAASSSDRPLARSPATELAAAASAATEVLTAGRNAQQNQACLDVLQRAAADHARAMATDTQFQLLAYTSRASGIACCPIPQILPQECLGSEAGGRIRAGHIMIGGVAALNALPDSFQPALVFDCRGELTARSTPLRNRHDCRNIQLAIGFISKEVGIRLVARNVEGIARALSQRHAVAFVCEAGHHRANGGAAFGLLCLSYHCGHLLSSTTCMKLAAAINPLPLGFQSHLTKFFERLESFRQHLARFGLAQMTTWHDPGDKGAHQDDFYFAHESILPGHRWLLSQNALLPAATPVSSAVFTGKGQLTMWPGRSTPGWVTDSRGKHYPITQWALHDSEPMRNFDLLDNSALTFKVTISDEVHTTHNGQLVAHGLARA